MKSSKRRNPEEEENRHLEWSELVLPWLPPPDLAAVSLTCRSLHRVATSITSRRISDASRNLETHPIPFLNPVDTQPYSWFHYTRFPILPPLLAPPPPNSLPWGSEPQKTPISDLSSLEAFFVSYSTVGGSDSGGCVCVDCSSSECPCSILSPDSDSDSELIMTECGASCDCGPECGNRLTQRGVSARLVIIKDSRKGWGLHAAQLIKKGGFICEYAGEFLTTEEARKRQKIYDKLTSSDQISPALLVVREHLPSGSACLRINIDATVVGNVARFINHSCDGGNLSTILLRNTGSLLPRLCFFAARNIEEGEELTFSYGEIRQKPDGQRCFCGTSACLGVLPSEET